MRKNTILYFVVLLIILKQIFHKHLDLVNLNVFSVIYYLLLAVLSFILFKNYKPKKKVFWLVLLLYILIIIAISVYTFFKS